jgi:tetratricopeptide (TPR) repeat protein
MTLERPVRLKHTDELGPLLRAAEPAELSAERLADNAAGVKALIASGTAVTLWKLLALLGLVVAAAVPLALFGLDLGHGRAPDAAAPPAIAAERAVEVPPAPGPSPAAAPPASGPPASRPPASAPPPASPSPTASAPAAAPPPAAPIRKPPASRAPASPAGAELAPPPAAASPPSSDLPEQIRLYEAARDAGKRGDFPTALALLDELLRRFPATPLRSDADLTRADVLARANQLDAAIQAFEKLTTDDAHRGRRGELLRTLGDLHRRAGDCTRALAAYSRAQAEHLSARDRAEIERGRDRCHSP